MVCVRCLVACTMEDLPCRKRQSHSKKKSGRSSAGHSCFGHAMQSRRGAHESRQIKIHAFAFVVKGICSLPACRVSQLQVLAIFFGCIRRVPLLSSWRTGMLDSRRGCRAVSRFLCGHLGVRAGFHF